jgi:hypothetical protein
MAASGADGSASRYSLSKQRIILRCAVKMIPLLMRSRRILLVPFLFLVGASGGCKQGPWMLWNAYATRFIDEQGRVIDPQGGNRTTSEGQSYALFFALADNDRARFDQVLKWTQNNLAAGNLGAHRQDGCGASQKKATGKRWTPILRPTPMSGLPTRWSKPGVSGRTPPTQRLAGR